jgi:hypothetical protein
MSAEVRHCFVVRGTDSGGGLWMTRELIWPSCDSPEHRRYVRHVCEKKAQRMNASGANVVVQYQELVGNLWEDSDIPTIGEDYA